MTTAPHPVPQPAPRSRQSRTRARRPSPLMSAEDAARFERDVVPCLGRLHAAAFRLTGNRADAEDLVQDTYVRAFRGFHTFTPGSNLRAWLFRILNNTWFTEYQKRKRAPRLADLDDYREVLRCPRRGTEDAALDAVPDHGLRRALAELRPEMRLSLWLAYAEGYTYTEIAEITGVPRGTVMSRLHRGRERVRALLVAASAADASAESAA